MENIGTEIMIIVEPRMIKKALSTSFFNTLNTCLFGVHSKIFT